MFSAKTLPENSRRDTVSGARLQEEKAADSTGDQSYQSNTLRERRHCRIRPVEGREILLSRDEQAYSGGASDKRDGDGCRYCREAVDDGKRAPARPVPERNHLHRRRRKLSNKR